MKKITKTEGSCKWENDTNTVQEVGKQSTCLAAREEQNNSNILFFVLFKDNVSNISNSPTF